MMGKSMVKIITDSGCMMNVSQGEKLGVKILPLSVTIGNQTYLDIEEMESPQFLELIEKGLVPTSSQPSIGSVHEVMEEYAKQEDVLDITMADGLSGTYQSAMGARELCEGKERITVFNSKTLCGPQKHLVELAGRLVKEGKSIHEIVARLEESLSECRSFLMPSDFNFLRRGGRMTPLAATMGGLLKIKPVVAQTLDGKRLDKFHMGRTFGGAIDKIIEELKKEKVGIEHKIYVSHANAKEKCDLVINKIRSAFPGVELEIIELTPAMITQGGPGCIAIQFIRK